MSTGQADETNAVAKQMTDLDKRLTEEIMDKYTKEFEEMIRADEWSINGDVFHSTILNNKRRTELVALQKEDLDEDKDPEKYTENYRKRAMLLIKEIEANPTKFDEVEYLPLENLLVAWSRRAVRGFPLLRKSIRKETTTQV